MPSIQIAVLKAYLEKKLKTKIQAFHSSLNYANSLGYEIYDAIRFPNTELAEMCFAQLLEGPGQHKRKSLFKTIYSSEKKRNPTRLPSIKLLTHKLQSSTEDIVSQIDQSVKLVGISVVIYGVSPALYIAQQIKKRRPEISIVIGGPALDAHLGRALVDRFPQVDYFIYGEGEVPLHRLIEAFRAKDLCPEDMPSLYWRNKDTALSVTQIEDLDILPPPDYDDYYDQSKGLSRPVIANIGLSVEFSRGCWWGCTGSREKGCSFCILHQQWKGYRLKSAAKIKKDMTSLARRYDALNFFVVDNVQPPSSNQIDDIYRGLRNVKVDLSLAIEIRAHLSKTDLDSLRTSRNDRVQIGIEALHDGILKVMRKGTSVYQNLRIMKYFQQRGLDGYGCLILRHPGCKARDIIESARLVESISHFRPLVRSNFKLERGSDVFSHPAKYKLKRVRPNRVYTSLLGRKLARECATRFEFDIGDVEVSRAWSVLEMRLNEWHRQFFGRDPESRGYQLAWRMGSNGIHIEDWRSGQKDLYLLNEVQSRIFMSFDEGASVSAAAARCGFDAEIVVDFLNSLKEDGLVYFDGNNALALPFRAGPNL